MDKELIELLFQTSAFHVAPEDKPFWYTSGKLGPYFINVDYLYGSEQYSKSLLSVIDELLVNNSKEEIPSLLCEKIMEHYNNNKIFKTTIDKLVEYIKNNFDLNLIDYISGGERRDWYFSIPIAYLLEKPHITMFKDLSAVTSTSDFKETKVASSLSGKKLFHIADILNTGSSFEKSWAPAANKLGAKINWALFTVDRNQHGGDILEGLGIKAYSLIQISEELFNIALNGNIITKPQYDMLCKYYENPDETMKEFIKNHPTFIDDVINNSTDEKAVKRAKVCKEKNYYGNY